MILRIEDIKSCCNDILAAVDSNELSVVTETLELVSSGKYLLMNVTNREYYAQVRLNTGEESDFHATVNANQFLKLISLITTDTVEFTSTDNTLIIKGNGTYKLPLIFDNDKLLELPTIDINNVTAEFDIASDVLTSILQYNSKQLSVGAISKPVQRMYYVDDEGALTFTSGACVNNFKLEKPVKMLLNSRLVKLFKLFRGKLVHFVMGYDEANGGIIQTKVRFFTDDIMITAILPCDDNMINSVPVSAIRGRASSEYPYSVNFNTYQVLETMKRLLLFSTGVNTIASSSVFEFNKDSVTVYDSKKENKETIYYNNDTTNITETYTCILDLNDLRGVLESCSEQYVTIKFGDKQAIAVCRQNVVNIIPEMSDISGV